MIRKVGPRARKTPRPRAKRAGRMTRHCCRVLRRGKAPGTECKFSESRQAQASEKATRHHVNDTDRSRIQYCRLNSTVCLHTAAREIWRRSIRQTTLLMGTHRCMSHSTLSATKYIVYNATTLRAPAIGVKQAYTSHVEE